uniref:Uncharacterized protein n=1 Tax=Anguilla anguilla TaxID=7936 RepID=A0A0E9XRK6_ANGAN
MDLKNRVENIMKLSEVHSQVNFANEVHEGGHKTSSLDFCFLRSFLDTQMHWMAFFNVTRLFSLIFLSQNGSFELFQIKT